MATRIAIIGAGCAGLGAATELMNQGDVEVAVTLIDANNWLGGRARTSTNPVVPIDLGPQFIQDPKVNPWLGLMAFTPPYDKADLKPTPVDTRYRVELDDDEWETVDEWRRGIVAANSAVAAQFEAAAERMNQPIMTGNAPEFIKGQQDLRLALGSSGLGPIGESAEPWQYVAADNARQLEIDHVPNIYVPGGLGTYIAKYGETLIANNASRLRFLNKLVDTVDSSFPTEVELFFRSGETLAYDFCLVTVPSPVLDRLKIIPPFPEERAKADRFLVLGSYKKVAFKPAAFPADNAADAIAQKTEYYLYDREEDGVWQYFRLPTDPAILICVTAGDFAARLDDEADAAVKDMVIDLLTKAHPTGNFAPQQNAVVVTNWTKTPNIGGAYSYTRFDGDLGPDDPFPLRARELISTPHGRIRFAGEATYLPAYGTIHGAYISGVRAAQEVVAAAKG